MKLQLGMSLLKNTHCCKIYNNIWLYEPMDRPVNLGFIHFMVNPPLKYVSLSLFYKLGNWVSETLKTQGLHSHIGKVVFETGYHTVVCALTLLPSPNCGFLLSHIVVFNLWESLDLLIRRCKTLHTNFISIMGIL